MTEMAIETPVVDIHESCKRGLAFERSNRLNIASALNDAKDELREYLVEHREDIGDEHIKGIADIFGIELEVEYTVNITVQISATVTRDLADTNSPDPSEWANWTVAEHLTIDGDSVISIDDWDVTNVDAEIQ
jgi:hypothetical protein